MFRYIAIAMLGLSLTACVAHNNQEKGAIIGGAAGGLLGTTIGKGTGNAAATIGGAVLGTIVGASVGKNMDDTEALKNHTHQQVQDPSYRDLADPCARYIGNEGAYASCQRGVAQANEERQRALEEQAYKSGRGY